MPLSKGTRLGSYEVIAPIGKGGMGEVYRARDTKLKRDVALKVLPDAFVGNADRMAQFQREAEVLASLNHPNIAAIYGIEERAIVMELVEGETVRGPLPLDTALNYAGQIAEALEAAHEKGITHRDLKPANIMITPDGVVKVLDFGLAQMAQPSAASGNPMSSPTLTMRATEAGMILGTAAYMAPEQARGQAVDKRADIWAFGVVLYEMLAGKRLFAGPTMSDTLAQVLKNDLKFDPIPAQVRPILERCLRRDPRQRWRCIGDVRVALEDSGHLPDAPQEAKPRASALRLTGGIVGGLLIAVASFVVGTLSRRQPAKLAERPLIQFDAELRSKGRLGREIGTNVILSPDGTRVVFVSIGPDGAWRLNTRKLSESQVVEMPGTRGARAPFFSPDGLWVGFLATGKVKKTAVDGGSPVVLCDAINLQGASWGEDGGIIAVLASGLSRIPDSGGAPTVVLDLTKESASAAWPQILPGGRLVLFTRSNSSGCDIEVLDLVSSNRRVLVRGGTFGRYLPNGYLVYINQGTLFAVPWGPHQKEVRGAPTPVLSGVSYSANFGYADLDLSRTGVLVYGKGGGGEVIPRWLESGGKTVDLAIPPGTYRWPHLSPDGKRLALSVSESGECGTAIFEMDSNRMTRVPSAGVCYPIWNPGGHSLFSAGRGGGLFWFPADNSGSPKPLTRSNTLQVPWSLTPNGDRLAYYQMSSSTGFDLWTIPIGASAGGFTAGTPELFLGTAAFETYPTFSPNGHWLAYDSNDSGTFEIYVRAFPDNGTRVQVSTAGGLITRWSPNGRELFYRTADQRIMVAAYTIREGSFVVGSVRQWSPARLADTGVIANFDLSPDGHRILGLMPASKPEEQQAENHVTFVLNFLDEVRRRVPLGK